MPAERVRIAGGVWLAAGRAVVVRKKRKRTSSLLVCFCRLALTEEAPASLAAVPAGAPSWTGRGIPECPGLLLAAAKGMAPRPPWRPGVPRRVPGLADMMAMLRCCCSSPCDGYSVQNTESPLRVNKVLRCRGVLGRAGRTRRMRQATANEVMDQTMGWKLCGHRGKHGSKHSKFGVCCSAGARASTMPPPVRILPPPFWRI